MVKPPRIGRLSKVGLHLVEEEYRKDFEEHKKCYIYDQTKKILYDQTGEPVMRTRKPLEIQESDAEDIVADIYFRKLPRNKLVNQNKYREKKNQTIRENNKRFE